MVNGADHPRDSRGSDDQRIGNRHTPASAPTASARRNRARVSGARQRHQLPGDTAVSTSVLPCATGVRPSQATTGGAAMHSTATATALVVPRTRCAVRHHERRSDERHDGTERHPRDIAAGNLMEQPDDPERTEARLRRDRKSLPPASVKDGVPEPERFREIAVPVERREQMLGNRIATATMYTPAATTGRDDHRVEPPRSVCRRGFVACAGSNPPLAEGRDHGAMVRPHSTMGRTIPLRPDHPRTTAAFAGQQTPGSLRRPAARRARRGPVLCAVPPRQRARSTDRGSRATGLRPRAPRCRR